MLFNQLNLSRELNKAIEAMGFTEATPIQEKAIPYILNGQDVIGQAQTGTGKTAAFGIPAIERIDAGSSRVQLLVICPTRELALQTTAELSKLLRYKEGVRTLAIYGGQPIKKQIMMLKKCPQIIIGTPGRIMDHLRRRTLRLSQLQMLVLDEADEMLKMGFREDINTILQSTSAVKQTVLFSATMPRDILLLAKTYLNSPVNVQIETPSVTVSGIEQYYVKISTAQRKTEILSQILRKKEFKSSIVFCNTKRMVDDLAQRLKNEGYSVGALHGDMRQVQRDQVMSKFRKEKLEILVATDVAARGVDVSNIGAVFNYDLPKDKDFYVHRVGRTGRAGCGGSAYTFVNPKEVYLINDVARFTKSNIMHLSERTLDIAK